jgi:hypothetical protein
MGSPRADNRLAVDKALRTPTGVRAGAAGTQVESVRLSSLVVLTEVVSAMRRRSLPAAREPPGWPDSVAGSTAVVG